MSLDLIAASATFPGLATPGAQTFAGAKTFSGKIKITGIGGLSVGTSISDSFNTTNVVEAGQSSIYGDANQSYFSHNVYFDAGWKSASNTIHNQIIFDNTGKMAVRFSAASAATSPITWVDTFSVTAAGLATIGVTASQNNLVVIGGMSFSTSGGFPTSSNIWHDGTSLRINSESGVISSANNAKNYMTWDGTGQFVFGTADEITDVVHVFTGNSSGVGADFKHTTLRVQGGPGNNSLSVLSAGNNGQNYCALILDRASVDSYLWFSQSNTNRFRFITTTNDTWYTSGGVGITGQAGYVELGAIGKTGGWEFGNASAANTGILLRGNDAGYTATALKYYEQGTFNPSLNFSGGNGTRTYTSTGYYTRIGNVCHFQAFVQAIVVGTASGAASINLPFASANSSNLYGTCSFGLTSAVSVLSQGNINPNDTNCTLLKADGVSSVATTDFGGSSYFHITISYLIA